MALDLTEVFQDLHTALSDAQRILLSTHENPDGDGLGSLLAMCEHLKSLGKDCRALISSKAPVTLQFMDPEGWLEEFDPQGDEEWLAGCDLGVVLDLGNYQRLGSLGLAVQRLAIPIAVIDHHPPEEYKREREKPSFKYTLVDREAPAAGSLVWRYLKTYRQEPMTLTMATALYAALITDTGSFKYNNTNVDAHRMAIDLLEAGIRPYDIHKLVFERRTLAQARLLGMLIDNMEFTEDQRIGWCVITRQRLEQAGAQLEDIDGFSEFIRTIKGIEVAVLLTELAPGSTKVSLRSKGRVVINDVAQQLGGGGHAFASGIIMEKPWSETLRQLLPLVEAKVATTALPE